MTTYHICDIRCYILIRIPHNKQETATGNIGHLVDLYSVMLQTMLRSVVTALGKRYKSYVTIVGILVMSIGHIVVMSKILP